LRAEPVDNPVVIWGTADSLTLSVLTAFVCGAALLLTYGVSPWWGGLIMWLACPSLVLFSIGYVISDLLKLATRRQAMFAAVLLIPTAIVVWHFRFPGLDAALGRSTHQLFGN